MAEEILNLHNTQQEVLLNASNSGQEIQGRQRQIEEMTAACAAMAERRAALAKELKARSSEKEQMAREQKGSFEKREHLSQELNRLDRELFRLNDQMEKLEHAGESLTDYMWQEYELTLHAAQKLKSDDFPARRS